MSWPQAFPLFVQPPDSRPLREVEQDILDELEFHLEMRTLDNISAGMSAADARQAAVARFGDFERIHQACRKTLLGERIMLQRVQTVLIAVLLIAVVFLGVQFYRGQEANREAMAQVMGVLANLVGPTVIQTMPESGDMNVDPATKEIRITYNRLMLNGSWSWCHDPELFKSTGKPHYEADGRTCVLPVTLEPGKVYAISLNTDQYRNFKDATGRSAVPYLLQFRTRGEPVPSEEPKIEQTGSPSAKQPDSGAASSD